MRVVLAGTHVAFSEANRKAVVEPLVEHLSAISVETDALHWPVAGGSPSESLDFLRSVDLDRCPLDDPIDAVISLDWLTAFLPHRFNVALLLRGECPAAELRAFRGLLDEGLGPRCVVVGSQALAVQARSVGFAVAAVAQTSRLTAADLDVRRKAWEQLIEATGLRPGGRAECASCS